MNFIIPLTLFSVISQLSELYIWKKLISRFLLKPYRFKEWFSKLLKQDIYSNQREKITIRLFLAGSMDIKNIGLSETNFKCFVQLYSSTLKVLFDHLTVVTVCSIPINSKLENFGNFLGKLWELWNSLKDVENIYIYSEFPGCDGKWNQTWWLNRRAAPGAALHEVVATRGFLRYCPQSHFRF